MSFAQTSAGFTSSHSRPAVGRNNLDNNNVSRQAGD